MNDASRPGTNLLLATACFVVVVAGMQAAQSLIVPFLLAAFIAIICAPATGWMKARGAPDWLALIGIVTGIVIVGLLLIIFVGAEVNRFLANLPGYQENLSKQTGTLVVWLNGFGIELSLETAKSYIDPGKAMALAANMLAGFGNVLANSFFIILTVIFILLEASGFSAKMHTALKDAAETLKHFDTFTDSVNRYLAMKTLVSLATGLFITLWLWLLGVDHAILWGLVAFLLNYVPNIGSIIAAVPAVLLALVQIGPGMAALAAGGYVVVNIVMGNVVEPRIMGKGLGLSTLVIFLSLVFWGWVFGPVGMLLSVPLTMIVKIALESSEETHWLGILLGTESKLNEEPERTK